MTIRGSGTVKTYGGWYNEIIGGLYHAQSRLG